MTKRAFETCEYITYELNGQICLERVVGRVRPSAWGLRKLKTETGRYVRAIDVLTYR